MGQKPLFSCVNWNGMLGGGGVVSSHVGMITFGWLYSLGVNRNIIFLTLQRELLLFDRGIGASDLGCPRTPNMVQKYR
jgi:hypothetical protein